MSLTGASGGFAVPVTLDPTIIPTSNGAVNPWRAISRVEQITGNTWNGVSAGAIVASRDTEFQEVSDDSPTLANPSATVTKAQAFVPFSIEVGQDWGSLESEMATLIQDAKDVEEATAFATGAGTGVNPEGVLTGATGTVAAGTAAFAVANLYALVEALPARFRPNAVFVGNLAQYNRLRQFDTSGGANLWVQNLTQGIGNDATGNLGATLLGRPAYESSVMASVLTAGSKLLIFGDFRYYLIVDRIGMTVEVIPHLFGATNQRPIGSRGLLAYWRNTGKVLSAAAFKTLVTT
jgi:HK97 family phage major capsid protein